MRILLITNFFSSRDAGGSGATYRAAVRGLEARGHDVRVLTSASGVPRVHGKVHHWLQTCLESPRDLRDINLVEAVNQGALKRLCAEFQPDVVVLGNLTYISLSLASLAAELGFPTCYYVVDNWLASYEMDPYYQLRYRIQLGQRLGRMLKLAPPPPVLDLSGAAFAGRHLRSVALQVDRPVARAPIIHAGIDVDAFPYNAIVPAARRLLFIGQIEHRQGLDTAVEAVSILKREHGQGHLRLTVAGDAASEPEYLRHLRDAARRFNVEDQVRFVEGVGDEDLPGLYREHDLFVLPSVSEDSYSVRLLEAMACGLAVVGTATGGVSDILRDGHNAVTFPRENARYCARAILRLIQDPALYERVRSEGRSMVEQGFRREQTVEGLERLMANAGAQECRALPPASPEAIPSVPERAAGEYPSDVSRRAAGILRLGKALQFAQSLLQPVQPAYRIEGIQTGRRWRFLSSVSLSCFPAGYEAFFRLRGRRRKAPGDLSQVRGVLVTQPADVGDVVLTSPFLRELRRLAPQAWIGLIVQPGTRSLVEACPYVDEVLTFDHRAAPEWASAIQGHLKWWSWATRLAKEKLWHRPIDLAISLRWNNDAEQVASFTCLFTSGASRRVGYVEAPVGGRKPRRKASRLITDGVPQGFAKHEVERQLDLLRYLGGGALDSRLELWTTPEDDLFAWQMMQEHGITKEDLVVVFSPGAGWAKRRWPMERFVELGMWLQESYGAYILIIGSKQEQSLGAQIEAGALPHLGIEQGLRRDRTINLTGKTTLRQTASVLRHCRLFVGNDSGPMHMAAAAGALTIGLFGSGEYKRFRPWGANSAAVRLDLLCSPCGQNCKFDHSRCIHGITVGQVKQVIMGKIGSALTEAVPVAAG